MKIKLNKARYMKSGVYSVERFTYQLHNTTGIRIFHKDVPMMTASCALSTPPTAQNLE
jgi:hypothetical protein